MALLIPLTLTVGSFRYFETDIHFHQPATKIQSSNPTKAERFLECVHKCCVNEVCRSALYNKTSKDCWMLNTDTDHRGQLSATCQLICVNLRQAEGGRRSKKRDEPKIEIVIVPLKTKSNYKVAERKCTKMSCRLIKIDSQDKQDKAAALAKDSGLDKIAIGVHKPLGRGWRYSDHTPLTFSDWATQSSGLFRLYAGLSKKHNYRWKTLVHVDGAMCECDRNN